MNSIKLTFITFLSAFILNSTIISVAQAEGGKLLRAAVAVDQDTEPTNHFSADTPKIYAFYLGEALKAGDKLRGVWIAEDVGTAAPKNTKIDEASIIAKSATDKGAFSLSKPDKGWPTGNYRIEIYVGEKLADTVKFKISSEDDDDDEEGGQEEE